MTLSELINWHRAEGIAAWKRYGHALTHGLKSAAQFRRAFIAHGETVEGLTELHCRRQAQLATGTSRRPYGEEDEQCRS
jgi:plasmid stabilization system protein ParE